jgi:hypothetical protein
MDIYKAIHDLIQEKKRLDAVIASLETRSNTSLERSRRGRKSMSPDERAAVSRRMAAYWAARRGQAAVAEPSPLSEAVEQTVEMPPPIARAASGFEASIS